MKTKFNWAALMLALVLALTTTGCVSYTERETVNGQTTVRHWGSGPIPREFEKSNSGSAEYTITIVNTRNFPIDITDRSGNVMVDYLPPSERTTVVIHDPVLKAVPHRVTDRDGWSEKHDCRKVGTTTHSWVVMLREP